MLLLFVLTACRATPPALPPDATGDPFSVSTPATATATITPLPAAPPSPSPAPAEPVVQGGTAILGLPGRPERLNPITDPGPVLQELTPLLYDTLLQIDPQTARLQPGLAQSWEYSDDGRKLTFQLPAGLKWSDGIPFTAADLADSLEATRHPALLAFSDIEAPDATTLTLTFATLDCAAVTALARLPLIRASEITATVPAGSGPFVVEQWSPEGHSLTLTRNDNYRQPAAPALEGLYIRFLDGDEFAIALSEGQFDLVGPVSGLNELPEPPSFETISYPAPQMIYVAINFDPQNGESISPELRQALLPALDRTAILAETLGEDGYLLAGSLLPEHWAAPSDLPLPAYVPEEARRLLAKTGLRDTDGDGWLDQNGDRLEFGIRLNGQNGLHQDLGWLVSSYYRDLGLFIRAESVPADSVIDDLFTHDFNLAIFSWPILPDPDQRRYWHSAENKEGVGLNFTSYNNPKLDTLLQEAVAVPGCKIETRADIYADVQQILAEERPVDFLLAPERQVLVGSRLHGVRPGPFAPLTWNVTGWYLEED